MLGFLNVYKPSGLTSNTVVQKIKKKFNIKKIGHMGTPIAIGKATRLFDYGLDKTKRYTAIFDFGYTTDTLDIEGNITNENGKVPTSEDLKSVLHNLIGNINQIPPIFSAKNVNGVRAYDLARKGIEFKLKPKEIIIYKLDLIEQVSENRFKFDIVCSSGTYIRAIARDIANLLNTYACMSYLERSQTGIFNIETSINLDDLINTDNKLEDIILSPIDVFSNFDILNVDINTFKDLINGKKPKISEIKNNTFVVFENKIVGVSKPQKDYLHLDTFLYE